ncbi:glycosyltransferase family 4 protein [Microbacterium rhizomatis]|uniref:Glycosyltransferase family 4 protein n=1 Tax=Microbacterium rhizomatis TaxID=1631477 RepID=A0A5J5J0U9_9MICO|nr:glycosyltransferase family 4 protein [Microbacterium rhizomatis]KAA9106479.1 glycosyltransferase family 4 protein [Microbacterium rhizomatis]
MSGRFSDVLSRLRRARDVGMRGVAQRVAQRAYRQTGAAELSFQIAPDDLLTAVPDALPVPARRPAKGAPLVIGWIMSPPTVGSGGHTTLFRMIESLEKRGHTCIVYIYDMHGVDVEAITRVIRRGWAAVRAEVRDADEGLAGVDAAVASSWEMAHVLARRGTDPLRRLYFIQDYEPYFYAHGAEYEFAKMTYRLPYRRIALGEMLDAMLREGSGVDSDVVPFGCDSSAYGPPPAGTRRSGIVFYCRPDTPRRGYFLARAALEEFHRMHPNEEIHVYGARPEGLDIPVTFHGRLSTDRLNELYGRTVTGLAMSFTNITLVAEEMLAAGNIPVVNDMELAHLVLPNPHVRWAEPTARSLAEQLSAAVSANDIDERAAAAAASVVGRSWQPTHDAVVRIIEEEVYGA